MLKLVSLNTTLARVLYAVIVLSFFFQALTWSGAYRFFAYLALLLGIAVYFQTGQQNQTLRRAVVVCLLPFAGFLLLESLATLHFPWDVKATRHMLLATGLMVGIVLMAVERARIQPYFVPTLMAAVYAYTLSQCTYIYLLGHMYGTTKNPHYLAIYSALFLVVASFLAANWVSSIHRYGLALSATVLGFLLLNTSSRPTWIALMIAILIGIVCLRKQAKIMLTILAGVLIAILFVSDAGNFKTRMGDLVMHANTEERVTIWEDTWAMQQQSSHQQWLFGHGVGSFESDFQPYSRYYANEGLVYNSPHNVILELLYQFGLVGLVIVLGFIGWLYYALFARYFRARQQCMHDVQMLILLLLTLFTVTLVTVSITLPFFVSIHLNVIALVMGVMFYLDKREQS